MLQQAGLTKGQRRFDNFFLVCFPSGLALLTHFKSSSIRPTRSSTLRTAAGTSFPSKSSRSKSALNFIQAIAVGLFWLTRVADSTNESKSGSL